MNLYVGVDVSKLKLDIHLGDKHFMVDNTEAGLILLIEELKSQEKAGSNIALVACEASGGYERLLIKQLRAAGYNTHLAHANHVKNFARATGQLAKTDKLDAKLISHYAETLAIEPDSVKGSEITEEIKELIKRREQLVEDRRREKNRLETPHPTIRPMIEKHIKWLDKELANVVKSLEELSQHEDVKEQYQLLTSIPSVGLIVGSAIIGYLPEVGLYEHKKLSSLAGVAPYNCDSGQHQGKRFIKGGRKTLRNYLYMAALSSLRWNKDLKRFYDRLRAKGKPAKLALTAVMRKLLMIISSVITRGTPWQEQYKI